MGQVSCLNNNQKLAISHVYELVMKYKFRASHSKHRLVFTIIFQITALTFVPYHDSTNMYGSRGVLALLSKVANKGLERFR